MLGYEPGDVGSIPPLTTIFPAHKVGMTGPVILGRTARPPLTLSLWASRPLVSPPALVSSPQPLVHVSPCQHAPSRKRVSPCPRAHVPPKLTGP